MPKVSVIIPAYNRAYIINEAIASVLSQTFTDFEVLIIDDGSTDNTRQVIESIGDERIRYFHKDNGGASSARNVGLTKATGNFIAFLDTDDHWPDNYLEKMIIHFENDHEIGIAYCMTSVQNSNGKVEISGEASRCHSGMITANLFVNSVIWPSAAIIRKTAAEGFYFDEKLKNSEDSDIFLRLSTTTRAKFVNDVAVFRGSSEDSLSNACGINCSKILVLERFYYNLGGDKFVPKQIAIKKLSRACRRVAERFRKNKCKKASLFLYKKAVCYYPLDIRLYIGTLRTLFLNKDDDPEREWEMPEQLGMI